LEITEEELADKLAKRHAAAYRPGLCDELWREMDRILEIPER